MEKTKVHIETFGHVYHSKTTLEENSKKQTKSFSQNEEKRRTLRLK